MTVPRGGWGVGNRVSDVVRNMIPHMRQQQLSADERRVAVYLRGNDNLFEGLTNIIKSRIEGRATLPLPSDPQDCMASMARDRELRWLLGKLEFVYRSPVTEAAEQDGERPA